MRALLVLLVVVACTAARPRTAAAPATAEDMAAGHGVSIYVFDGGIRASHPELAGRVRKGYDGFPADKAPCNSHGTAVAGAAAGRTLGMAPGAEIVDVKMIQCASVRGSIEAIVAAAAWTAKDARKHGRPAVANWSFVVDTLRRVAAVDSAVAILRAAGVVVVVSAGNTELDACGMSPANAGDVIVVGAATRDASRRAMGAFGRCVDVYAPGDSVVLPAFDEAGNPTVQAWNGTSMSAGYASGAAAAYLASHPGAATEEVRLALEEPLPRVDDGHGWRGPALAGRQP